MKITFSVSVNLPLPSFRSYRMAFYFSVAVAGVLELRPLGCAGNSPASPLGLRAIHLYGANGNGVHGMALRNGSTDTVFTETVTETDTDERQRNAGNKALRILDADCGRYPMRYGRNRTTSTMIAKVSSVWIISVCVCLPLFVMGFVDRSTVYSDNICVPTAKQVRGSRNDRPPHICMSRRSAREKRMPIKAQFPPAQHDTTRHYEII